MDSAQLGLSKIASDSGSSSAIESSLVPGDPVLEEVADLISDYGGIIFIGPPGTGKTWYAAQVALELADGDVSRVRFLQFHPSYQYEDFVEGYVPGPDGNGFVLTQKHLIQMCKKAETTDGLCFLVIDELSRGDPGRIFGEALTYLERSKRGLAFQLSSGTELVIPENLIFLATMNPMDRGVDEVDAALERRFAKIAMEPSAILLRKFLTTSGMDDDLVNRVVSFFEELQHRAVSDPGRIGHTYFMGIADQPGLQRLWRTQLSFVLEKAYRLDPQTFAEIEGRWKSLFAPGSTETNETSGH